VKARLLENLLGMIERERMGEQIDRILMKDSLSMLVDLGVKTRTVYTQDFEEAFLATTQQFYANESRNFIASNTCSDYLRKAEERLSEERERVSTYLDSSTELKLRFIVETQLIKEHCHTLVNMEGSGCASMLKDDKLEDLNRLYRLFKRVPAALDAVRKCLSEYIVKKGSEMIADTEITKYPVRFVTSLLEMRDKFDVILCKGFENDREFEKILKNSFETFINKDQRCAQFLSMYTDELLKAGLKGMGEREAEAKLDKVIVIFRYLMDKDIFENFYKTHLAKRLLGGRSVSSEAERSMIGKLKQECGFQFTAKLEGMFKDINMSKETNEQYRRALSEGRIPKSKEMGDSSSAATAEEAEVDLSAHVLTTGFWPTETVPMCILPNAVQVAADRFSSYYLNSHTGRRLTWLPNQGNADVTANFKKKKFLIMSTYQMCVCMLFNDHERLKFKEIKELTNIPTDELKRHLLSMSVSKFRVFKKLSAKGKDKDAPTDKKEKKKKSKDIFDNDMFVCNVDFKSSKTRVRIPLIKASGLFGKMAGKVGVAVEEDRRHLVEAAIVRIMKTRKTLEHNNLISEVTRQLTVRFRPSPQLIKKRIESLIEREYLKRSDGDRRMYDYLA
jgi:cullin 3